MDVWYTAVAEESVAVVAEDATFLLADAVADALLFETDSAAAAAAAVIFVSASADLKFSDDLKGDPADWFQFEDFQHQVTVVNLALL